MKKIGKFKICSLLGKGGMGQVYKIEYPVTGKIAALKLLKPNPFLESLIDKQTIEEMFTAEAIKMASIRHANIVEILDFDSFNGKLYYIMNFYCNNLGTIIGESYETEKKSRVITIDKAIYYTRQILSGLSRLHFSSIIHRDIKPYNILVTDDDVVKICDFGLSKLRKETFKGHKSLKIGSPYYASPELEANPDNVDFTCDLYAVGIMLFRMITGRLPKSNKDRPSLLNRDIGPDWDAFILKAIHPSPEKRYESASAMQRDLDELDISWNKIKERIKSVPLLFETYDASSEDKITLRIEPKKIPHKNAAEIFNTDELMRPRKFVNNRFDKIGNGTLLDKTTNLFWQIAGTKFPVNHDEACAYIDKLNREKYGGIAKWRLPTVNELLSLVSKNPQGEENCIEKIFDIGQKWLWSCDKCTYITAWYVSMELGYAGYNDLSSYYHVKAVCSV